MDRTDAAMEVYQMMYYLASQYKQHIAFLYVKEPILLKLRFQLGVQARSFP
jgi:hypothetical protein